MFRPSVFGARYTRRTAAAELMLDLADALSARSPVYMLGGGNPARIPEVEAVFGRRLREIAADATQFGRFAGQYSDPAGDPAFRDAVAAALSAEFGWRLERANVALTAGSQVGFFFLFNWLAGLQADGRRRRLLLPLAPEYIGYADLGLADDMLLSQPARIEREADGFFKYRLDTDSLTVPDDVAAICVSRPTNPSGNVLTVAELERLDAIARARGVPLVIDAAYGLPFPGLQFDDPAAYWNENVILCLSLSKLGLPGARTGIVVADASVVEAVTAFNATAALAPAGTAATIAEPLLRSGELLRLCRDVVRPHYTALCRQAIDRLRDELWRPAACHPSPRRRVFPLAVVSGAAGDERGALSAAESARRVRDFRAPFLPGARCGLAAPPRVPADQLFAGTGHVSPRALKFLPTKCAAPTPERRPSDSPRGGAPPYRFPGHLID